MTYTIPFIHKYRLIVAILLTALISTSIIAFKLESSSPAQAAPDTKSNVSYYIAPVFSTNEHGTTPAENGLITATGKVSFPKTKVTTVPAPKKVEPVVKKTVPAKPDTTKIPVSTPAAAVAAPAAQAAHAAAAAAPVASTESAAIPVPAAHAAAPAAPMAGTSPAAAQAFARSYLASKGLGEAEFQCLVTLWNHESGWNFQASNSSSGAYGIPQSLPGSKMASAGADWQTNPATQIKWGLGYIDGRYGTPCGAVASWNIKGWY